MFFFRLCREESGLILVLSLFPADICVLYVSFRFLLRVFQCRFNRLEPLHSVGYEEVLTVRMLKIPAGFRTLFVSDHITRDPHCGAIRGSDILGFSLLEPCQGIMRCDSMAVDTGVKIPLGNLNFAKLV